MSQTNLFAVFTDRLASAGVEYMVTGSVASVVNGEPRVTHDIDLVIWTSVDEITNRSPSQQPANFAEIFSCGMLDLRSGDW